MLTFSEIFEFSREDNPKIPILKEFEWFEWFEWFGPSPIEPFNSGERRAARARQGARARAAASRGRRASHTKTSALGVETIHNNGSPRARPTK